MVALTDTIIDVAGQTVTDIHTAFVRCPAQRPSYTGQGLVSTRPVSISDTGVLSVDLEPGPAVLVVLGESFHDTWELYVEDGQSTIRDAVAAVPGTLTQHEVSVMRTLLDGAQGAAGTATSAAEQTASDRQAAEDGKNVVLSHVQALAEPNDAAVLGLISDGADTATKRELNATYANKLVEQNLSQEAAQRQQADDDLDAAKASRAELPTYLADAIAQDETVTASAAAAVDTALVGRRLSPALSDQGAWSLQAYPAGSVVDHDNRRWVAQPYVVAIERTNLVINPRFLTNPDTGIQRSGWSQVSGSTLTPDPGASVTVTLSADATSDTLVLLPNSASRAAVVGDETLSAGVTVTVPSGAPTLTVSARIGLFPGPLWTSGTPVTVAAGETARLIVEGVAVPADRNESVIGVWVAPGAPSGASLTVSEPIMEKSSTVGTYFDGDTPDVSGDLSLTYSWAGTAWGSVSNLVGEESSTLVTGTPGTDPSWVRLGAQPSSARTLTPPATYPAPETVVTYVTDMKPDGITLLSVTGWHVRTSTDEGKTWTVLSDMSDHGFTEVPASSRWLPDGEILLSRSRGASTPTTIYRSVGASSGGPVTWELVHTWTSMTAAPAHGWSFSIHENIVLVAEYGTDKSGTDNPRHVYLSVDMGRTFTTIRTLPNEVGIHMHGVAWDPYWDRIWITWGDDRDAWEYSDDLGATWHIARYNDQAAGDWQGVGIYPLPDCILIASDGIPNGLWRIPRSQGKHQGLYTPEVAFQFNDATTITHLCHAMYQRRPGDPVLLGWGAEVQDANSRILATRDGYDVCDIWEDPYLSAAGTGLRSLVGPTARGNVIWEKQDGESSAAGGGRLRWTTPWPGGY